MYAFMLETYERNSLLKAVGIEKPHERPYDAELSVSAWQRPGQQVDVTRNTVREDGAPSWWVDDEEASNSFLAAMGVRLE